MVWLFYSSQISLLDNNATLRDHSSWIHFWALICATSIGLHYVPIWSNRSRRGFSPTNSHPFVWRTMNDPLTSYKHPLWWRKSIWWYHAFGNCLSSYNDYTFAFGHIRLLPSKIMLPDLTPVCVFAWYTTCEHALRYVEPYIQYFERVGSSQEKSSI